MVFCPLPFAGLLIPRRFFGLTATATATEPEAVFRAVAETRAVRDPSDAPHTDDSMQRSGFGFVVAMKRSRCCSCC